MPIKFGWQQQKQKCENEQIQCFDRTKVFRKIQKPISESLNQLNKKPAIAGRYIKLIFLRIFMRGRDYPRLTYS